jgi:hypothetical protein
LTAGLSSEAYAAWISIGLLCKTKETDTQPAKPFSLNLARSGKKWAESEPGGTSIAFKTKSGTYVVKPDGTYLVDGAGKTVGFIRAFHPDLAKDGERRFDAQASETGLIFEWEVAIITN